MEFLRQVITRPTATGAIAASSVFLARTMVEGLELDEAEAVLEYGPGTGVFTELILRGLKPTAKFAAIEVNPKFAEIFKTRYPSVLLFEDTVTRVRTLCDSAGIAKVDCIVSGLPWAIFSESMQVQCLDEMMRVLKPGGQFATFAYVHSTLFPPAKRFSRLLGNYFTSVSKSPVVWLNVPPAFVYRCRR